MNRMITIAVFLSWSLCACDFDTKRQLSLELPVTIIAHNTAQTQFDVLAIYSDPQTGTVFSMKGGALPPGDKLSIKAPESAFDVIKNKTFFVDIKCPRRGVVSVEGKDIDVTSDADLKVELRLINPCK